MQQSRNTYSFLSPFKPPSSLHSPSLSSPIPPHLRCRSHRHPSSTTDAELRRDASPPPPHSLPPTTTLHPLTPSRTPCRRSRVPTTMPGVPPGIQLARRLRGGAWLSQATHRGLVLFLTFVAYASYHASRKPPSIVKGVLSGPHHRAPGWAPFDGPDGTARLGEIDVAFLACYALGMYAAGHLADRLDLRLFLAAGMVSSGAFVALFGAGYFWGVHAFGFFLAAQMLAGLAQASGWPSVVAVVGNWFGVGRRGLIMGVWNAHTSVGNICGSLLAASMLRHGWGWSFVLPAAVIAMAGVLVFLFLAPYPEDLGFPSPYRDEGRRDEEAGGHSGDRGSAIGMRNACCIPGVIQFALCLFFTKLVAYTFLYWLPFYLSHTPIGGEYMSVESAGNLSTLFDVGGILGGILAGYISDKLNARATTAAGFMFLAFLSLLAYYLYGGISQWTNIFLMMITGLFVNGPYALITTAVSADLGTHSSLRGDSRALATVTAIIDGTGSVGAAFGPLLTGYFSRSGWGLVFLMLMIGAICASLLLLVLVRAEIMQILHQWRSHSPDRSELRENEGSVATPFLPDGS